MAPCQEQLLVLVLKKGETATVASQISASEWPNDQKMEKESKSKKQKTCQLTCQFCDASLFNWELKKAMITTTQPLFTIVVYHHARLAINTCLNPHIHPTIFLFLSGLRIQIFLSIWSNFSEILSITFPVSPLKSCSYNVYNYFGATEFQEKEADKVEPQSSFSIFWFSENLSS